MPISNRLISEHIVKFTMTELRNQRNRRRAGLQLRSVTKYANKMKKEGHIIENIKGKERGYTGKGLFYGIRVIKDLTIKY